MANILAADIGGTTCKLGLFSDDLELLHKWEIPTETFPDGGKILEDIHEVFVKETANHGLDLTDIIGVGLGVPGPVDFKNGIINGAINLNWNGKKPISYEFEKMSGIRTIVDNDANIAALGEQYKGAGSGYDDVVMMTLGTGVGGGIVVNGLLAHGHGGAAGEIGHIHVDTKRRFQCNCGKKGCLETVASATGIVNLARHHFHNGVETRLSKTLEEGTVTSKAVVDAAKSGDALGIKVLDEVAGFIGLALSDISVLTNPNYFIIGGGVSRAGDILMDRIRKHYKRLTFPPAHENTEIVFAELGNDAGIHGAARLVKQYLT
ncbi:ROK family glucokinase [Salinicoccus siamensis]|uniref:Glucokinase n=1 Tax=Salinicoccus siamensis TaxID=381830 RepID=A0ABV5Z1L5_9STAP